MTNFNWKKPLCALTGLAALSCVLLANNGLWAADYNVGPIHISEPWARATPKGASSAAAYLTITNNGSVPDRVSCVSTDISSQCQIHSMTMDNGVMKMRPVEGGLEIKPSETVALKPAGLHVMLVDLKRPLKPGEMIEATFRFDSAGTVKVTFPVVAIGAAAPGTSGGGRTMEGGGGMMQMKH